MNISKLKNALFIISHLLKAGCKVYREDGEPIGEITEEEEDEALAIISDLVKRANKYRWHDLRKNPEDIPRDSRKVIVCVETLRKIANIKTRSVVFDSYTHNKRNGEMKGWLNDNEGKGYKSTVIAWREIEPFEESEE